MFWYYLKKKISQYYISNLLISRINRIMKNTYLLIVCIKNSYLNSRKYMIKTSNIISGEQNEQKFWFNSTISFLINSLKTAQVWRNQKHHSYTKNFNSQKYSRSFKIIYVQFNLIHEMHFNQGMKTKHLIEIEWVETYTSSEWLMKLYKARNFLHTHLTRWWSTSVGGDNFECNGASCFPLYKKNETFS